MSDEELDQNKSFYDDQNYQFDIDQIYNDFILEIDAIRSNSTFIPDIATKYIKSLLNNGSVKLNIENTPQESRAHAFYRLIGFPVLAADGSSYSPGHDSMKEDRKINKQKKLNICLNPIVGFDELVSTREKYIQSILKIFSKGSSISASALVISSGGAGPQGSPNLRKFISPFDKNNSHNDMASINQSYEIENSILIGGDNKNLSTLKDENNEQPTLVKKYHIIKPFIVNGKIDFMATPSTKRVCVPFTYDKSYTLISDGVFAKRPLIEKIIREKLFTNNTSNSEYEKRVNNYIQNISTIKDIKVVDRISTSDFEYSDREQFANYLKMIQEMMNKLIEAADIVKSTQEKYLWLPETSKNGPEGGLKVKPLFFPKEKDQENLLTEADKAILLRTAKVMANNFTSKNIEDKNPNNKDYSFDNFTKTFNKDTTESMGDVSAATLDKISKDRKNYIEKANAASRTIEIIMGEFSGLGLCDIFAIQGALHILPLRYLLGLIDDDAFDRMNKILKTNIESSDRSSPDEALEELSSIVFDFYGIMDKIYIDKLINGIENINND